MTAVHGAIVTHKHREAVETRQRLVSRPPCVGERKTKEPIQTRVGWEENQKKQQITEQQNRHKTVGELTHNIKQQSANLREAVTKLETAAGRRLKRGNASVVETDLLAVLHTSSTNHQQHMELNKTLEREGEQQLRPTAI